jgi:hypothetical protein
MVNEYVSKCRSLVVTRRLPSPTSWVHVVLSGHAYGAHGFADSPVAKRRHPYGIRARKSDAHSLKRQGPGPGSLSGSSLIRVADWDLSILKPGFSRQRLNIN